MIKSQKFLRTLPLPERTMSRDRMPRLHPSFKLLQRRSPLFRSSSIFPFRGWVFVILGFVLLVRVPSSEWMKTERRKWGDFFLPYALDQLVGHLELHFRLVGNSLQVERGLVFQKWTLHKSIILCFFHVERSGISDYIEHYHSSVTRAKHVQFQCFDPWCKSTIMGNSFVFPMAVLTLVTATLYISVITFTYLIWVLVFFNAHWRTSHCTLSYALLRSMNTMCRSFFLLQ